MNAVTKAFHDVFGQDAQSAKMGEYTVMPDGVLKREKHADVQYGMVEFSADGNRVIVRAPNREALVIEACDAVTVEYPQPPEPTVFTDVQQSPVETRPIPEPALLGVAEWPAVFMDILQSVPAEPGGPVDFRAAEAQPDGAHELRVPEGWRPLEQETLVRLAHGQSGMKVDQWNALTDEERALGLEQTLRRVRKALGLDRSEAEGQNNAQPPLVSGVGAEPQP